MTENDNQKPLCSTCPFYVRSEYETAMIQHEIRSASRVYCKLYDEGNSPCGSHISIQDMTGITFYNDIRCNMKKKEELKKSQNEQAL